MIIFLLFDLPNDPKTLYELALSEFNNKNYKQAEKILKRIIYSFSPNEWTDKAQFYLALLYYERKNYELAKIEAEFFVNNFKYSEFYPRGLILLAKIYYKLSPNPHKDISELNKAIEILNRVKTLYPSYSQSADSIMFLIRKKFAQKILISANVYRNIEKPKSEAIYLEYYLNNYIDIEPDSVAYRLLEIYETLNEKEKIINLTELILKGDNFSSWVKKIALEKRDKYGYRSDRR